MKLGDKVYPVKKAFKTKYNNKKEYIQNAPSKAAKFLRENGYFYIVKEFDLMQGFVYLCGANKDKKSGDFFLEEDLRTYPKDDQLEFDFEGEIDED